MQATTPGHNRTGAAASPREIGLMMEAVRDLSPEVPIDTARMDAERLQYIVEADSVGSIPPPATASRGRVKKGTAKLDGISPALLLDKLGERLAFERAGTRLYDALIAKYIALAEVEGEALPPFETVQEGGAPDGGTEVVSHGESALQTLRRIRDEEHRHFLLVCEAVKQLGGDPTAQTPCADVSATATMGLMQVVTDPRTTMAQCLNAALIAELADNAGWDLLAELAAMSGQTGLGAQFLEALEAEQEHLAAIRGWLRELVTHEAGTQAV